MEKPTSPWEIERNPSDGRSSAENRSTRETQNEAASRGGGQDRRHANWTGRYQLSFKEFLRIYSLSVLLIAACFFSGLILSWIAYLMASPIYRATGTFLVDEMPMVQASKQYDPETERQLVQTLILSIANRDMQLDIEKKLGLPQSVKESRIAFAGLDRPLKFRAGKALQANIQVASIKNSRMGAISADSQSPEFASKVVNAILDQLGIYNFVGGAIKTIQISAAFAKTQSDDLLQQVADATVERIKLERENKELEKYLKLKLPIASYPAFAKDPTLSNLKTQLFLVDSEYKALAATSTRGPRLEGKAAELKSLRYQIDSYANKLAEALRSEYTIRLNQEKDLLSEKQKAALKIDQFSQEATRLAQSFGDPDEMRQLIGERKTAGMAGAANMIVVVNRPPPPVKPYRPLLVIYLLLGGALGGIFGFGLTAVTLLADHNVVSAAQIETQLSVPCLAVIRELPSRESDTGNEAENSQFLNVRSTSPCRNLLRNHVLSQWGHSGGKIIGFSPVSSKQRASEMVADLAQALAKAGKRTLVVDLHFEAPLIAKLLGVELTGSIAPWFQSQDPIAGYLSFSKQPGLAVFSPYRNDLNLVESLALRPMNAELTSLLGKDWDLILIDAPCIIPDRILVLALPLYSPIILSADFRRTKMSMLSRAISTARMSQWRMAGVVIIKAPKLPRV